MADPLKLRIDKRPAQLKSKSKDIRKDLQRKEAFEMVIDNVPIVEIARHFGKSPATIYDWIDYEYDKVRNQLSKMGQIYRAKVNKIYDDLLREWVPLAQSLQNKYTVRGIKRIKGKEVIIDLADWEAGLAATDRVLKIAKQVAEMNGLLAPLPEKGTGNQQVDLTLIQLVQNLIQPGEPKPIQAIEVPAENV